MSRSAIARFRQQIEREIAASKQAISGYATVARHEVITHHYERISFYLETLKGEIGDQEAAKVFIDALEEQLS